MAGKYNRYNEKCKMYSLKFRKDKDERYIEYLDKVPNRVEFIRQAIDRELNQH